MASLANNFLLLLLLQAGASHRLPPNPRPLHYKLHLFIADDCTFRGKVLIELETLNSTDKLEFYSSGLTIDKKNVFINEALDQQLLSFDDEKETLASTKKKLGIVQLKTGKKNSVVEVNLVKPLKRGKKYQIYLGYNGTMTSDKTSGIYCWPYKVGKKIKLLTSTAFEPNTARKAFPGWDEPGFKARFTLQISHTNTTKAISNMPSIETTPMKSKEGWVRTDFKTSPKMPTYLLSWLVSEFKETALDGGDRAISAWTERGKDASLLLHSGSEALTKLEEILEYKEPLPKHDLVAIREHHSSGLENWGIIAFRESRVLGCEKSSLKCLRKTMNLVAHEIAHSWFGNLVTPVWWDEIWLSEGLATYLATKTVHQLKPEWGYERARIAEQLIRVMTVDSMPSALPLTPSETPKPLTQAFNTISYNKGALVMWMAERTLGWEAVQGGLREYVKAQAYGGADESKLWEAIGRRNPGALPTGVTLKEVMKSWVHKSGYPLVNILRNYESGTVTITQRSVTGEDTRWWIPITFMAEHSSKIFKFWLNPAESRAVIKDPAQPSEWLMFNINATALYRVEYDSTNRGLLSKRGWGSGRLEEVVAVMGGTKPRPPTHAISWIATVQHIDNLLVLTQDSPLQEHIREYAKTIVEPEFERLGGLDGGGDEPQALPLTKLACSLPVPSCVHQALRIFGLWADPTKPDQKIDEDTRYTVICTAVRELGGAIWDYLKERLLLEKAQRPREDILKALACSNDTDKVTKYLDWALVWGKESGLQGREIRAVVKAISEIHPDIALSMLSQNLSLKSSDKKMKWGKVLEILARHVHSERQLKELEEVAAMRGVDPAPAVGLARRNLEWLKENIQEVKSWSSDNNIEVQAVQK